jgi:hypothetical protein
MASKKPKVLRYTWEELTDQVELDAPPMEDFRLMYRSMLASGPNAGPGIVSSFCFRKAVELLMYPAKDLAVVVYRAFKGQDTDLKSFAFYYVDDELVSMACFCDIVESTFALRNRPVPIITGECPQLYM